MRLTEQQLTEILRNAHGSGHVPVKLTSGKRIKKFFQYIWNYILADTLSYAIAIGILITITVIFISYKVGFYQTDWIGGVLTEAHGMIGDVIFLVIGLTLLSRIGERRQNIHRHQETIDDYREWNTSEAARRIAGSIRRLNKLHASTINLSHCYLQNVDLRGVSFLNSNLSYADFRRSKFVSEEVIVHKLSLEAGFYEKISGYFYYGNELPRNFLSEMPEDADIAIQIKEHGPNFKEADLSHANLSGLDLRQANFESADLHDTNLKGCTLDNANFSKADLNGADLNGSTLVDACFDGARGITVNQLIGARSLHGIRKLDHGIMRELIREHSDIFQLPTENNESAQQDVE